MGTQFRITAYTMEDGYNGELMLEFDKTSNKVFLAKSNVFTGMGMGHDIIAVMSNERAVEVSRVIHNELRELFPFSDARSDDPIGPVKPSNEEFKDQINAAILAIGQGATSHAAQLLKDILDE